ncbi:MAG: polyprenyl synthetase family protein [Rectinemataceae bacterium]|nr:polyprenyl synthetase family protein [Rectinemataceae bacterium]
MDIKSYLNEKRFLIRTHLSRLTADYTSFLEPAASSAHTVMNRILDFSNSGKMIRGSLVFLGHDLFSSELSNGIIDAASAMEFFQAGLLIHDDIMDRDTTRRGMPTVHTSYSEECMRAGSTDPGRAGEALGICAGDICFFLGNEALSRTISSEIAPTSSRLSLISYCSRELARVGLAQMKDVEWALTTHTPSPEEVIRMYQYKTARYTFSMPLAAGALLADRPDTTSLLESIGEKTGIVFQIRDDELGLFASESELGKPIGSDIREGKKTLYYIELLKRSNQNTKVQLSQIFGNSSCSQNDIEFVQSLIISLGIRKDIDELSRSLQQEANSLIDTLSIQPSVNNSTITLLKELAEFATCRNY